MSAPPRPTAGAGPSPETSREMSPEMASIVARLAEEDGHLPDVFSLPPDDGRAQFRAVNARWNVDLPAMALATGIAPAGGAAAGGGGGLLRVPPQARPGAILYLHGGGWGFGSPETHERAIRCLALSCAMPVVAPRYRLAPEAPFPHGLADAVAAWRALAAAPERHGLRPGPLGVAGDSAGANLALALILHELAEGRPRPDFAMLFYGAYGADFATPSYRAPAVAGGLTRERMMTYWDRYLPDRARRGEPLAAPLAAGDDALRALPPLYLNAAALDPLLDDTLALHARLARLGRDDVCVVHDGVIHGFMQMTTVLEEARVAFESAGRWCRARTAFNQEREER